MQFAVNYSPVLAELVRAGQVHVDRFKCPAWPALLDEARQTLPLYIHFPLSVGSGAGMPQDEEKHAPADLERFADLLERTDTPYINTHLGIEARHFPDIPIHSRDARHAQTVISAVLRDLEPLIKRFGAERVLVENLINQYGWLELSVLPEVLGGVLEATGCGFLFDQSHARLAARNLGLDARAYTASLPVERIREVHITGLQVLEGALLDQFRAASAPNIAANLTAGMLMDHFPMTPADWPELDWLMAQFREHSNWSQPWVVSFEYGGVGKFWEDITDKAVYLEQLPRMGAMIKGVGGNFSKWAGEG